MENRERFVPDYKEQTSSANERGEPMTIGYSGVLFDREDVQRVTHCPHMHQGIKAALACARKMYRMVPRCECRPMVNQSGKPAWGNVRNCGQHGENLIDPRDYIRWEKPAASKRGK